MKLAILWWSGRVGQQIIQQALSRGRDVYALVRHLDKLMIDHPRLTVFEWDATNTEDVLTTIQNTDVVVHAVSVPLRHRKPTTLYSRVTQAVIDARPSQFPPQQYIVMSSTGTDHGRAELHRLLRWWYEWMLWDAADDKELEEQLLAQSLLPRTIIKAVRLMNTDDTSYKAMDFADYNPSLSHKVSRVAVANAICDIASQQSDLLSKTVILSHK